MVCCSQCKFPTRLYNYINSIGWSAMPKQPLRQRAACVRCHSQKLRCPERRGQEQSCARCLKAGAQCVFGLSMRGLRPKSSLGLELRTADEMDVDVDVTRKKKSTGSSKAPYLHDVGGAIDVEAFRPNNDVGEGYNLTADTGVLQPHSETFDTIVNNWNCSPNNLFPDFDIMSTQAFPRPNPGNASIAFQGSFVQEQPAATTSALNQIPVLSESEPHETSDRLLPQKNRTSIFSAPKSAHECIKNLSKLSLDLYEHAAIIPPLLTRPSSPSRHCLNFGSQDVDSVAEQSISKHVSVGDGIGDTQEFPIDDTFHLTTALLDIICCLDVSHPGSAASLMNSPETHRQPGRTMSHESIVEGGGDGYPALRHSAIDSSTIMLVVSCYTRLMDIYECLFGHIKACVEHSILPINRAGHPVSLPAVKVGSYKVSSSKSVPLQVMTILQLSASVGDGIKSLLEKAESSLRSSEGRMLHADGNMLETVCKDVRHRTTHVSRQTRLMWKILYQSGLLFVGYP